MLKVIYPTTPHPWENTLASRPWHFDPLSALIGAVVALLLAALAYKFRRELRAGWEGMIAPLLQARQRLQASAEDRYRELVITHARSLTVAPHVAPLDAVFVPPQLLPLAPSYSPEGEPAGRRELALRQIWGGHPQLAILGEMGTGRTALLAYLALACARDSAETEAMLGQVQKRLPLYLPLPAMNWEEPEEATSEEETTADKPNHAPQKEEPVEKLVNAATSAVGGKGGLASVVRQYLEAGQAILLADGWDELTGQQRQLAADWLAELSAAHPGNLWLVAAGTRGYAPLTEAGFVPLTLAPWGLEQIAQFAALWAAAPPTRDETSPLSARKLANELQNTAHRELAPLELALRAFVYLADQKIPPGRARLFERALDLLLVQEKEENGWIPTVCRLALGQLASQLQQERRTTCTRSEIEAAIAAALPPAEELPANASTRAFRALVGAQGALRTAGADRYTFAHPLWQAYLAARQLIAAPPATLIEHLNDPWWAATFRFYAELGDMGPLVTEWLRTPDDLFFTRLRTLGDWIGLAPPDAAWRDGAMAVLARAFLKEGLPAPVRLALAESLAATHVPGVAYLFKQALRHPDGASRTAAILGLARAVGEAALPTLEAALQAPDPAMRQAAVRGLAHVGVDTAIRQLTHVLLEGEDELRLVAAEELARCGEQGREILIEAAEAEDVLTRRGAVYGLGLLGARETLEKIAREDEQWIVRSAATAALEQLEQDEENAAGLAPPPEIGQMPWLISWAAAQGEGAGTGESARRMLLRALTEGDTQTRLNAIQTLAQIGHPQDATQLQDALTDPDPAIAATALDALAEISRKYARDAGLFNLSGRL